MLLVLAGIVLLQVAAWAADKPATYTQKDFARMIVQQFQWTGGLPKESADRDYLLILGGKRTYRYEAESAYNPKTDRVSMREYPLFGSFTGKGWIMGVSTATTSTMTVLLPIDGEYDLKAVIKGNGFIWNINGKDYQADSKSTVFRETDVAKLNLKAGVVTVTLTIPPEGAIDSFSLSARDYPSVQPYMGWRFKDALTAARLAETAVSLTNSYAKLPDADQVNTPKPVVVVEKATFPPTASATNAAYLGPFSSSQWLRANFSGATVKIPFTVTMTGYYTITANILGEKITGTVNGAPFELAGKIYLSRMSLGLYRLETGENSITVNLPPMGGIDVVDFIRKSTKPEDFLTLAAVPGPPERKIKGDEAIALVKKIQGANSIRK
jgi:hypothetical protein